MRFTDKLRAAQQSSQSFVCVGLDTDAAKLPLHLRSRSDVLQAMYEFNAEIISATQDLVCAYKPNLAFYEVFGSAGWQLLEKTLALIPKDKIIIADAKRGDIGNTARMYAEAFFVQLGCDAVTVAPYMGADSVLPFLQYEGKSAIILGLTSNSGSKDFEELMLQDAQMPLYQKVVQKVVEWNKECVGEAGLVVGATKPEQMFALRNFAPNMPFLVPGVGAQGGDAASALQAGTAQRGSVMINSSRQILYASDAPNFAEAARQETMRLNELLNSLT